MTAALDASTVSRRTLIASATAASVATAGCLRELRSVLTTGGSEQLSLSIAVIPASNDPVPIRIANRLRDNLEAIGIGASIELRSARPFRVDVLYNHDFDLAITTHPQLSRPDALYSLLHSTLGPERGWQNPYGWDDLTADELLETQRTATGTEREEAIGELLTRVAEAHPLTPLWFPIRRRAVNTDQLTGGYDASFETPHDLLALEQADPDQPLSVSISAIGPTQSLNPLSVEHRDRGVVTGLLYEGLLRRADDELRPWLAEEVSWMGDTAEVTLRSAQWHDGIEITADDVAFTYDLLADTSLGSAEAPIPAPRFRGRRSLIDEVTGLDEHTIELTADASPAVAEQALTVPILPEHVWHDRTDFASVEGYLEEETITEALVVDNLDPIGSGPYTVEEVTDREIVELTRVEDHFVDEADEFDDLHPLPPRIGITVSPNDGTSLEWVADGAVDLTLGPLLSEIETEDLDESITLVETPSTACYHVMYNTRRPPLSNTNVRRVIAQLLDIGYLAEEVTTIEQSPTAAPLSDTVWVPEELAFEEVHPVVPFLGSSNELDVDAAQDALTDIGLQIDDEGRVIQPG